MFSKSCQYALQGVIYIALKNDNGITHVSLKDIADDQGLPYHFLSKILQKLVKQGILNSTKGAKGGFSIKRSTSELTLIEIVEIIDGDFLFNQCAFGLKECTDNEPCPIHHHYKKIRAEIKDVLSNKSIQDHIADINNGLSIISLAKIKE